jgi:flagellar motor switch protein FliN
VSPPRAEIRDWLFEEFSSHLATVFETTAGERPTIRWESAAADPGEAGLRWRQPFNGVAGMAWIAAAEPDWSAAGGHALHAAGIEESDPASLKSTYLETIGQALSGLAQAMGERLHREVTCASGEEAAGPAGDAFWASLHLTLGETAVTLAVGFDAELLDAFTVPSQATPESQADGASPVRKSKTFDLLLEVELPVSISFGRAQVPLKNVLKLTTGSIIELNRSITEPVEVIVNNCVIARGEVVVVDGNFGVRIEHVISRTERLRTLN